MNIKKLLKTIKLHETQISVILGIIILAVAGVFVVNYVKNLRNSSISDNAAITQNQTDIHKHTVEKGETLWSIAKEFYEKGSDWKKIADANNISSPSKLAVGMELIIPDKATKEADLNPQIIAESSPTPAPQISDEAASVDTSIKGANYIVEKGDSLWKIAIRAYGDGYKWPEIAKVNNLKSPRIIHKGNVFVIPR